MEEKFEQVEKKLKKAGQEHLLKYYERITDDKKKENFLNSILTIDFDAINEIYLDSKKNITNKDFVIEPIKFIDKEKIDEKEYVEYEKLGKDIIKSGKLAVVTMAGGQGTRLGHTGPKGTFDLGLESHKSIFEILCDTLKSENERYGVSVPWYIMTSDENNSETVEFFEKHNYFGYNKGDIFFFTQSKLPMVDTNGKCLIDEKGNIKEAADGHGGIFKSILKSGALYDMQSRGIEWVFIGGVDNVLVKPVDPVLIGLSIKDNVDAAGKSIIKANPHEKVGIFCKRNGRPSVIEYSEISDELAEEILENGELKYAESHILCNLFSLNAINKIASIDLPYHVAFKKAKYIDCDGNLIVSEKPNAYKFESFIFDAFEKLDDLVVLRVKRENEFAPVKNAEGEDSPETARKLYIEFHNK
ncbi:MAG: UDPGP type 1 family protein [Clostridiales bacterium]|nr:UDPGP type 1 family protein [Clostridiales bacterium]